MASIQERSESLQRTLDSIAPQMDEVHVYLNDYETKPTDQATNVYFYLADELAGDLGDAAKFYFIDKLPPCYYFTIDDDLTYHEHYAARHIEYLNWYNNEIITTYHGRASYEFPIKGYLKANPLTCINCACKYDVPFPTFVQFGGTGVMCIPTDKIKVNLSDFGEERNMADTWIGIWAQKNNCPILVVPHLKGEILLDDNQIVEQTIWGKSYKEDLPVKVINRELEELRLITKIRSSI